MKEIEVKFKIADKQAVIKSLGKAGVSLGDEVTQDDTSYAPDNWERGKGNINVPFLRVRREGDRSFLTMKKPVANQLDRIEHESEITDPDQVTLIVEEIGFRQNAHVVKRRRKAQHKGYEICVDSVEQLGDFVEIEKLVSDDADGVAVQKEIRDFLVGILGSGDGLEEVHKGYDILINE